jgi:hypothetical protein
MILTVTCGYCRLAFSLRFDKNAEVRAPARGFERVSCSHCGSRLHLDLNVRKAGKSTKLKQAEQAWVDKVNKRAREMYSETADAVVKTFDQLEGWDKNTWEGRAASELRKAGVTK